MTAIDAAIVVGFFAYCIVAGLRARAVSSRNLEEYFLAGRTLPGWKAGISMAATQFAADTPLLVTGLIATFGVFSLWRLWIYTIAFLMMGFLLGSAWRRAGVLTDAELAERRYGTRLATVLRAVKAIYFGTIFNCTVLAMVLLAATRIAEPFLVWNAWLPGAVFQSVVALVRWSGLALAGVGGASTPEQSANGFLSLLAVVAITGFYSTTGGLRAVANTDVVQFVIAMVGTAAYGAVLVHHVGGLGALPRRLAELYGSRFAAETLAFTPDLARDTSLAALGVIGIQWLAQMNADGTGYLAQRTMACRSDRDARQAAVVFVGAQVLLRSLLWLPIGLGLLILLPMTGGEGAAAREATFVTGVVRYLPPGLKGLMLTAMLAALASTVDTHLNWGASYWTNDIFRRLVCQAWLRREPSDRVLVWVARGSNLLIIAIAAAIMTRLDSIQSAWQASLLLGAGMGIPLVLRWLWWRMSAAAELAGIVTSSLLAPVLLGADASDAVRLLTVTGASAAAAIAAAILFPETSERVREFYRRAQPPGWWAPVAGPDADAAMRRFHAGATLTIVWSLATFCVLVAIGSWLIGSPAPAFVPSRRLWIGGLLACGIGLPVAFRTRLAALDVRAGLPPIGPGDAAVASPILAGRTDGGDSSGPPP